MAGWVKGLTQFEETVFQDLKRHVLAEYPVLNPVSTEPVERDAKKEKEMNEFEFEAISMEERLLRRGVECLALEFEPQSISALSASHMEAMEHIKVRSANNPDPNLNPNPEPLMLE